VVRVGGKIGAAPGTDGGTFCASAFAALTRLIGAADVAAFTAVCRIARNLDATAGAQHRARSAIVGSLESPRTARAGSARRERKYE